MSGRLYVAPGNLEEALDAVREHGRAGVVAGGTDAMVNHRSGRRSLPAAIVSLHRLAQLRGIEVFADGATSVGALTTHADLASSVHVIDWFAALADASAIVGSPSTRAAGTLGGNLVNASPAMDTGSPLLVLGATAELASRAGTRSVAVADLWTGPGQSVLAPDELLTAVTITQPAPRSGSAYVRLEYRRAMEIAVVGAACAITLDDDGTITAAAVALTAVGSRCFIAAGAGRALVGHRPDDAAAAAGQAAVDAAQPISDNRASATYRRHMVAVMTARAVLVAAARAAGRAVAVPATRHWRAPKELTG